MSQVLRFTFGASILAIGALLDTSGADAVGATFTVNTTVDSPDLTPGDLLCETADGDCSLRAAIQETNALGGSDTIVVPGGTYSLTVAGAFEDLSATGDLDIADDLTINGAGSATTGIDANNVDRAFHILWNGAPTEVTIRGVRVAHGSQSAIWNSSGLDLVDATIADSYSPGNGGGLFNGYGGTVHPVARLTNVIVTGNEASQIGGGIFSSNADLVLTDSRVVGNVAGYSGGGVGNIQGIAVVEDTNIDYNSVLADHGDGGGGLVNHPELVGKGEVTMTGGSVSHNSSNTGTGGILNTSEMNLVGVIVSENTAVSATGGIRNETYITRHGPAHLHVIGSTIAHNEAYSGGGITNSSATAVIEQTTISGNTAGFPSFGDGGGLSNGSYFVLPDTPGKMDLVNVTISGNTAARNGGGISNRLGGELTVLSSTIANNSAVGSGAQIYGVGSSTLAVGGTIIAGASSSCGGDPTIASFGHNMSTDDSCSLSSPGDFTVVDPLLAPLADNGGATFTHRPQLNSPAIDRGSNNCPPPQQDQRGVERPQNGICDIGAVEIVGPLSAVGGSVVVQTGRTNQHGGYSFAIWVILIVGAAFLARAGVSRP